VKNARTEALSSAGVSIWFDDLSRERIDSGGLETLISHYSVVGVTTNPTIFAKAIGSGTGYGEAIAASARRGDTAAETVVELMCTDVADACDAFAGVFRESQGRDGRVSIEVSPELAHDARATSDQAVQLWKRVNRPNAMIKIPATPQGLNAITETIAQGISVNVTLIFSVTRYREVINAYLTGLERARAAGHDLSQIHSVASFFVSRVDSLVDAQLQEIDTPESHSLCGQAGLAGARLAYEIYEQEWSSERARMLLDAGAHRQRPLWASTGVKDASLPDTLYVSGLVAEGVVNTMPEATLQAFADHGEMQGDTITSQYRESDLVWNRIDGLGIDYGEVTTTLEHEGLEKFLASWSELLDTVEAALKAAR
jgi:transaldolase